MSTSNDCSGIILDRKAVLKEYYAGYLKNVLGLSDSSVKKYIDALNHISRRLKEMGLVQLDIYEIPDLNRLHMVKEALVHDDLFQSTDKRGKNMYSSGLKHYCSFAAGNGFYKMQPRFDSLDVPVAPEAAISVTQEVWSRSGILRTQAFEMAGYLCEMNNSHKTFISESTNKPYMEGHHALPMNAQVSFSVSLDVYANIICLCPICHRKIHYGLRDDRVSMIRQIYDQRGFRFAKSGIEISRDDFVDIALGL